MNSGQNLARALSEPASEPRRWRVQGLTTGAQAFFLFRFLAAAPRPALIVTPRGADAERLADDLRFFFGEGEDATPFARRVHRLPSWDVVPFEDISPAPETVASRIEGLYHLRQTRNPVLVTTAEAVLQRVPPVDLFADRWWYLVEGDELDTELLSRRLGGWGYRRLPLVEDRGEFSIRGGIIDIFPPAHAMPLRLELIGDVIESIRTFDPVTQRSIEAQPEVLLLPVSELSLAGGADAAAIRAVEQRCRELEVNRGEREQILESLANGIAYPGIEFALPYFYPRLGTIADYLPAETLLCVCAPAECTQALEECEEAQRRCASGRQETQKFYPPPERLFQSAADWWASVERLPRVDLGTLALADSGVETVDMRCAGTQNLRLERGRNQREISFEPIARTLRTWSAQGDQVFLVASSETQVQRLEALFAAHEVEVSVCRESLGAVLSTPAPRPRLLLGHLSEGFRLPDERVAFVTEADLFGEVRQRRRSRPVQVGALLKSLNELRRDDYVVHLDHGLGIYRGLKHLQVAGTEGDYLHLEYAGGDRLYLPADRINLVQKYVGADGSAPQLDKLGGSSWERVKKKTRESILAMAKELLDIYATREVVERRVYAVPDDYFRDFEARFPFEETQDQAKAIGETLDDMGKSKPMDRLICGDVGYGKTEVALRAAFLAVLSGHQVAVLVPTTVLAQQHLATFRARFQGYPVRVEGLSRFQSRGEITEVLRGLERGTVDVVIGTHRLLQADVKFRELGLLVVDEEHRFGVRHKERIKQMRALVDVLTLTATPIPRTLQMSLAGIRDLSVIETPPIDRQAIRTYVTKYDEGLIREAILRELSRQGQVFFVHNRVETIEIMARRIRELAPEAVVVVAHGQMKEGDLEKVMLAFMEQKANVLVCSSIIESGLDIPNANTMIINRADHLGLAQLYQIRGRVGRSHQRAYAYLMIPGEHLITKDAQKRLQVLQGLDELGGGFRLAAHDLEIRGAGNLLGKQQSGHVAAIGFELYEQMLADAVRELRGEQMTSDIEPEIQLGIPAFIPDTYIADEQQRLVVYRRLAAVRTDQELEEVTVELRERYGPLPPLVDSFVRLMDLRRHLRLHEVVRAVRAGDWITLQFHPAARVEVDTLMALVQQSKNRFRLSQDFQLSLRPQSGDWDGIVEEVKSVLQRLEAS